MRPHRVMFLPMFVMFCVWMQAMVTQHSVAGQAPSPPPTTGEPAPPEDDGIEVLTKKSAAARLLSSIKADLSIDAKVAQLIDRLVLNDRDRVQAAITALTILGPPAVPSIVRRIDDRRDMTVGAASFENKFPGAFEGVRHLGVLKVIDCLNLVLNDLTGESYGFVTNDMDSPRPDEPKRRAELDKQRAAMIAGWRGYLARIQAPPRVSGKSLPAPGKVAK